MQVLFENYYNDALKYSEELYRKLRKNPPAFDETGDLITVVSGTPDIIIRFYKTAAAPSADAYAFMANVHEDKRSTVVTKTGQKRRRKLVKQGVMGINVANIINEYKFRVCEYYDVLKKFIVPVSKGAYGFNDSITDDIFLKITLDLITTNIFSKIFVHEVQHFYNPFVHQRAEQIRKYDTGKELTQRQQRKINYVFSQREINSTIAEAAASVLGDPKYKRFLSSPKFLRHFVNACIDVMRVEDAWEQYPDHLKQKMIKRWTQIFHERVKKEPSA